MKSDSMSVFFFLCLFGYAASVHSGPREGSMTPSEGADSPHEENCRNPEARLELPRLLLSLIQAAVALTCSAWVAGCNGSAEHFARDRLYAR